ncbi:MAG: DUF3108 domain-containing protein [Thiohalomonadales bacterium]
MRFTVSFLTVSIVLADRDELSHTVTSAHPHKHKVLQKLRLRYRSKFFNSILLIFILQCDTELSFADTAATLPHEFSAHYKLTRGIITLGKTHLSFKKLNAREYQFESVSKPQGVGKIISNGQIQERSIWILYDNTLRPLRYTYQNSDSDLKRDVRLDFDWDKGIVVNNINGDPWKMKLEPATQDKLLYMLSLMVDLAKGKRHLEYRVADGGTTKTYLAIINGIEIIDTDLGRFQTLKVLRKHHDGRKTILWSASSLEFIPIQIEQIKKDGTSVKARIYQLDGIPIRGRIAGKN